MRVGPATDSFAVGNAPEAACNRLHSTRSASCAVRQRCYIPPAFDPEPLPYLDAPSTAGDDSGTPLGDTQPFELGDDIRSNDIMDIAARGVREADEAERYAQYERELDECKLYSSMTQDSYTYVACKAQAFANYNQCRGY